MPRFAVYLYQEGGCDYTIACGQSFRFLPESVKTMEEARAYVVEVDAGEEGSALLGHLIENIQRCIIYEINASQEINIQELIVEREQFLQPEPDDDEEEAYQEFLALKARFEGKEK